MKKYTVLAMVSLLGLTGCATIISGSTDNVSISAMPENAAFKIKDKTGKTVHEGKTPQSVVLERGNGYFDGQTYQVDVSAPGYLSQSQKFDTSTNGWYVGNLVFGGLLGFLVVDPLTGAMWDFPEKLDIKLSFDKNSQKWANP